MRKARPVHIGTQRTEYGVVRVFQTGSENARTGCIGPEAVAVLKEQITALRDSIAARFARTGKNYWSNYTIEAYSYEPEE